MEREHPGGRDSDDPQSLRGGADDVPPGSGAEALREKVDLIGVSAGSTTTWRTGADCWPRKTTEDGEDGPPAAREHGGGCFGILEGGYNHSVLGQNVLAFIEGMEEG